LKIRVSRHPHKIMGTAIIATTTPIALALTTLAAADGVSPVLVLDEDGMAAAVLSLLGFTVIADKTADGVATVVLVSTVVAGSTTLSTPHAPVRVLIALMFVRAVGEDPQFSDWDIQMMFCSRSNTAIQTALAYSHRRRFQHVEPGLP
jgi:hypothetical protein